MSSKANEPEVLRTRFLVVGSGVAGLWTACELASHGPTLVITKRRVEDTNTNYAQGGIAVALCGEDSPGLHASDTILAGAGLCDEPAVDVLTREGPERVMGLVALGARFDHYNGALHCRREAAHGERRIIHAHGDATGAEIQRALGAAVAERDNITVHDFAQAVRLLVHQGQVVGLDALTVHDGRRLRILADATILASGGFGALYTFSTSPPVALGDGMAIAYRAGAPLQDMEFVQFHPTGLSTDDIPVPLISEAVRGEGAVLLNAAGERFMPRYHPLGDLAPRDIVSRAEFLEMQQSGTDHCLLDFSPIPHEQMVANFPSILEMLHARGFKIPQEPAPVRPVAHYTMGGVATDLHARAGLPRLYAVGECSCTGVHGANRLASNSLLEGLVFGSRAAESARVEDALPQGLAKALPPWSASPLAAAPPEVADEVRSLMWGKVGIIRNGEGLEAAAARLRELLAQSFRKATPDPPVAELEAADMLLVAYLTAISAALRTESRGGHYRSDTPQPRPEWRCHLRVSRGADGEPEFSRPEVALRSSEAVS